MTCGAQPGGRQYVGCSAHAQGSQLGGAHSGQDVSGGQSGGGAPIPDGHRQNAGTAAHSSPGSQSAADKQCSGSGGPQAPLWTPALHANFGPQENPGVAQSASLWQRSGCQTQAIRVVGSHVVTSASHRARHFARHGVQSGASASKQVGQSQPHTTDGQSSLTTDWHWNPAGQSEELAQSAPAVMP